MQGYRELGLDRTKSWAAHLLRLPGLPPVPLARTLGQRLDLRALLLGPPGSERAPRALVHVLQVEGLRPRRRRRRLLLGQQWLGCGDGALRRRHGHIYHLHLGTGGRRAPRRRAALVRPKDRNHERLVPGRINGFKRRIMLDAGLGQRNKKVFHKLLAYFSSAVYQESETCSKDFD